MDEFEKHRAEWPPIERMNEVARTFVYDWQKYVTNLLDVTEVLETHGIKSLLAFGTLLGAIRDGGPCEGDQDVDVMCLAHEHETKLFELWRDDQFVPGWFMEKGFEICRVSNHLLTVCRDDSYVDVYMFRPPRPTDDHPGKMFCCWHYWIDEWRIVNPWSMPLHGRRFWIPAQPESYLERVYGKWRIPSNVHADQ